MVLWLHDFAPSARAWCRRVVLALGLVGVTMSWASAQDFLYTVRQGDNPWNLTERYLLNLSYWPRLQRYNRITDPLRLQPGSTLRIPTSWLSLRSTEVRIAEAQGQVQVDGGSSGWQPVRSGQTLTAGQRLRTDTDGSATLNLSDGAQVLVRPGSELRLVQAQTPRIEAGGLWVRIELMRGGLENLVQRSPGSGTRFEIQTPAAVAAVRGTEFRVATTAEATRTEVLSGAVAFTTPRGSVALAPGTGSVTTPGQAPQAATPLLPEPDLSAVPARIERLPISVPLTPLAEAARYQAQLVAVGSTVIASDESSPSPNARARDVPDGDYQLRVRGVDRLGLEGRQAVRTVTIDARPEPPVLAEPGADATLASTAPAFRWSDAGAQASYRFQFSTSPDFSQPLADQSLTQPGLTLAGLNLPPGLYHWRVATRTPAEGQGPYSDVQRLRLVPTPPQVEPAAQDDRSLTLRWRAAPDGATYRFQLARDEQFADPVVDRRVDSASVTLDLPPAGTYLLRVQTLTADGFEGAWSSPQRITVEERRSLWPALLLLLPLLAL